MVSLQVLSKVYHKFLVTFKLVQNFEILNYAMVKFEKANITETYSNGALYGAPLGRLKTLASNIRLDKKAYWSNALVYLSGVFATKILSLVNIMLLFSLSYIFRSSKLKCLSLPNLFSRVFYLQVRLELTRVWCPT